MFIFFSLSYEINFAINSYKQVKNIRTITSKLSSTSFFISKIKDTHVISFNKIIRDLGYGGLEKNDRCRISFVLVAFRQMLQWHSVVQVYSLRLISRLLYATVCILWHKFYFTRVILFFNRIDVANYKLYISLHRM